jgi:hypothetical protein
MSKPVKPGTSRRERQLQLLTALSVLTVALGADGANALVNNESHEHDATSPLTANVESQGHSGGRHGRHIRVAVHKHIAGVKYAARKGGVGTADFTWQKRGATAHSHAKVTHNKVDTER